jgi:hypothetical protein
VEILKLGGRNPFLLNKEYYSSDALLLPTPVFLSRSVEGTFDSTEGTHFCEHEKEYMLRSKLICTVAYGLIGLGSSSMLYGPASKIPEPSQKQLIRSVTTCSD